MNLFSIMRRHDCCLATPVRSAAPLIAARQPAAWQSTPQQQPMTFFVTSEGSGKGADLGGGAGADQRCPMFATAAGAGDRAWHADPSIQTTFGQPSINAGERTGTGSGYSSKGVRIAKGLGDRHEYTLDQARIESSLTKITALTEQGDIVAGPPDENQRHDILTGSPSDGRAFTDAADHSVTTGPAAEKGLLKSVIRTMPAGQTLPGIGRRQAEGALRKISSPSAARACSIASLSTVGGPA